MPPHRDLAVRRHRLAAAAVSLVLLAAVSLAALPAATRAATLPAGARLLADQPYGADARQRIDVYLPAPGAGRAAPMLVMVHGGAWMLGDKAASGVVDNKVSHWLAEGWVFVSVNYRLWPAAGPAAQAGDVAQALAFVEQHAAGWGGDRQRLVLMGHSAGAHLAALLGASPQRLADAGVEPWRATIVLDSAALDLPQLMARRHAGFYDRVFGDDPSRWPAVSPSERLAADATPMLLVCSTLRRDDSCGQASRFADRLTALGRRAQVLPQALTHARINRELGEPQAYTDAVDAFIATVMAAP